MFRLLSDLEVSLNELLVACRESVDHFRDATRIIAAERMAQDLKQIADTREQFIPALENQIRALGDLPAMPDPDKEDSAMLLHHIGAAVSDDYTHTLLQQRIEAEKNILVLIEQTKNNDEDNACVSLLDDLEAQVKNAIEKLSVLAAQSPL